MSKNCFQVSVQCFMLKNCFQVLVQLAETILRNKYLYQYLALIVKDTIKHIEKEI